MFTQIVLNEVIANILGICPESFQASLDRGMRPVKAAIKQGASAPVAQLVASLTLATSVAEINSVYADTRTRSCMVGAEVGEFYHAHGIGVIHAPNYRRLVGLETGVLAPRGYGFHGNKVDDLLGDRAMEVEGEDSIISSRFWGVEYKSQREVVYSHAETLKGYQWWYLEHPAVVEGCSWYNLPERVQEELCKEATLEAASRRKDEMKGPYTWKDDPSEIFLPKGFRMNFRARKPFREFSSHELAALRRTIGRDYLPEKAVPEVCRTSRYEGVLAAGDMTLHHLKNEVWYTKTRKVKWVHPEGSYVPYLDFETLDETLEHPSVPNNPRIAWEDLESILPTRLKHLKPRKNKSGGRKPAKA